LRECIPLLASSHPVGIMLGIRPFRQVRYCRPCRATRTMHSPSQALRSASVGCAIFAFAQLDLDNPHSRVAITLARIVRGVEARPPILARWMWLRNTCRHFCMGPLTKMSLLQAEIAALRVGEPIDSNSQRVQFLLGDLCIDFVRNRIETG